MNEEQADELIRMLKPISRYYELKDYRVKTAISKVIKSEIKPKDWKEQNRLESLFMSEIAAALRDD